MATLPLNLQGINSDCGS